MNEITVATWNTATQQRDLTFLGLFFFAAVGLFVWRVYLPPWAQRLTAGLATVAHLSLLVVGVIELCRS